MVWSVPSQPNRAANCRVRWRSNTRSFFSRTQTDRRNCFMVVILDQGNGARCHCNKVGFVLTIPSGLHKIPSGEIDPFQNSKKGDAHMADEPKTAEPAASPSPQFATDTSGLSTVYTNFCRV